MRAHSSQPDNELSAKTSASASKKFRWRVWLPLLGLALLVWLLSRLDLQKMLQAAKQISGQTLALAALFFLLNVAIKTIRWQRMLRAQDIWIAWAKVSSVFAASALYGLVTVGRIGEFVRVEVALAQHVSFGRALASCSFDRILDLLALTVIGGVAGSLVFVGWQLAIGISCGLLVFMGVILWLLSRGERWMNRLLPPQKREQLAGWRRRFVQTIVDLLQGMPPLLRAKNLLESLLWTTIAWTFYLAMIWTLAQGLMIAASKVALSAATAIAALTVLLPITFQGLGTREMVFSLVLGHVGVGPETAVLLALLGFTVTTVTSISFGFVGLWFRSRQIT